VRESRETGGARDAGEACDSRGTSESLAAIARLVAAYRARHPEEAAALEPLVAQLARPERADDRATLPGHLTAAALLLHPARQQLLLVHHRALRRWLQPGGHLERDELPAEAARRELREETGVAAAPHPWHAAHALPGGELLPLDIDIHGIPANERKREPPHLHLDFRYVFVIEPSRDAAHEASSAHDGPALRPDLAEVTRLRWMPLDELAARDGSAPVEGLQRAARKLLAILAAS
jgi:8-oxo-dGTP pyrophosphatase MutT (NUDIX family)